MRGDRVFEPPCPGVPPPCGALGLPAQVVWRTVIGRQRTRGGESHLVARSGLQFSALTGAHRATLAECLQQLTAALQPVT